MGEEGGWVLGDWGRRCGAGRGCGTEWGEKGVGYGVILGDGLGLEGVVERSGG